MPSMRAYSRLLLAALFVSPALLLLIWWVDEPLARLLHQQGAFLKPFFGNVMRLHDAVTATLLAYQLWVWLALLLIFFVTRLLRHPHCTVWLVALLTLVSSQPVRNFLAVYFNRPRPSQVFGQLASNAGFWQVVRQFDAFPSGHATITAVLLMPWALWVPKVRPLLLGWLGLVCLGRVVLEYHWLSDVVAGVLIGVVLTCSWTCATYWLQPASSNRTALAAANAT